MRRAYSNHIKCCKAQLVQWWYTRLQTFIVWSFEFIKNLRFWVLKYFGIRELSVNPSFEKKTTGPSYVQKLREPPVLMKEPIKHWQFYWQLFDFFHVFLELWIYIWTSSLIFLSATVMTPKKCPDNRQGLFLFLLTARHLYILVMIKP
jgi:hypothetical protein